MASDYVPIACATHERLEFAVLRRQRLRLVWQAATGEIDETLLPLDVETRDGAEWLTVQRADGRREVLRLDRILHVFET